MFKYKINQNGEVIITGYKSSTTEFGFSAETELVIPAEIEGKPVTGIGMCAFFACRNLTSVTIPDSVKSIGVAAFEGCLSLKSVEIPDSVTSVGYAAFYGCRSLTSVTLPDSLTSIMKRAFCGCYNLEEIYYTGTEERWGGIAIESYNHALNNAKKHFKN